MTSFYVGQKVIITGTSCGHKLKVGSIVELEIAEDIGNDDWDLWAEGWVFDQDDCKPYEDGI